MTPPQIRLAVAGAFVLSTALKNRYAARTYKRSAEAGIEAGTIFLQANEILMEECTKLNDMLQTANERANYLIELLEKHDVPVTEYDLIVINSLTQ